MYSMEEMNNSIPQMCKLLYFQSAHPTGAPMSIAIMYYLVRHSKPERTVSSAI